jgi:hypothetical protein
MNLQTEIYNEIPCVLTLHIHQIRIKDLTISLQT